MEDNTLHERLVAALQSEDDGPVAQVLGGARAADIAEAFQMLRDEERSRVFFALPPQMAAEVIVMIDEAARSDVVDELDTESLTEIVSELPPDDAADVLAELSEEAKDEILEQLESEQSEQIEGLLEYDEYSAGGIMTPEVVSLPATATVADAVDFVRKAPHSETINEIYVVDADRHPVGTVQLRRLVTSPASTRLQNIASTDFVRVNVHEDQEAVVRSIRKYDASEAAVVDDAGRLVGRVTYDDIMDVASEEATEDIYRMAGTDAAEFETRSVIRAARIRLTWLIPCMLGMLLSALIIKLSQRHFDAVLFTALISFVPMIGATGGNSGIQTSTVIVRGFATGELAALQVGRVLVREGRIALTMAPICGVISWALVSVLYPLLRQLEGAAAPVPHPERVAMAVGCGMTAAILFAAGLGIGLPFGFRRIGVDPALASGPLVTTMNDVLSVSVYMLIAMAMTR